MTIYHGIASTYGNTILVQRDGGEEHLGLHNKEINHSPDGLNWGYLGSGPAQSAYALLCDYFLHVRNLPENQALGLARVLYQDFKTLCISRLPQGENWELDENVVQQILKLLRENRPNLPEAIRTLEQENPETLLNQAIP